MKVLNLVSLENSDIKYRIDRFPDGQQQVVIDNSEDEYGYKLPGYYYLAGRSRVYELRPVQVKARLNNFMDLELISCATKSLRNLGVKEIHLYTPYFLGSRSDRQFEEGSNNYLKDVICPIINSLGFESVTILDPHSDVLEACLNNFKKIDNYTLFNEFILNQEDLIKKHYNNFILISPDAGASKKIYKLAEQIGYKGDIFIASKERDIEGKLTRQVIPEFANERFKNQNKDVIIIDDICDGGATFIGLGKLIKQLRHQKCTGKTYLVVTHGIFSQGFEELSKYFDGIYCTNSYRQINNSLNFGSSKDFLKQLNVF